MASILGQFSTSPYIMIVTFVPELISYRSNEVSDKTVTMETLPTVGLNGRQKCMSRFLWADK